MSSLSVLLFLTHHPCSLYSHSVIFVISTTLGHYLSYPHLSPCTTSHLLLTLFLPITTLWLLLTTYYFITFTNPLLSVSPHSFIIPTSHCSIGNGTTFNFLSVVYLPAIIFSLKFMYTCSFHQDYFQFHLCLYCTSYFHILASFLLPPSHLISKILPFNKSHCILSLYFSTLLLVYT